MQALRTTKSAVHMRVLLIAPFFHREWKFLPALQSHEGGGMSEDLNAMAEQAFASVRTTRFNFSPLNKFGIHRSSARAFAKYGHAGMLNYHAYLKTRTWHASWTEDKECTNLYFERREDAQAWLVQQTIKRYGRERILAYLRSEPRLERHIHLYEEDSE